MIETSDYDQRRLRRMLLSSFKVRLMSKPKMLRFKKNQILQKEEVIMELNGFKLIRIKITVCPV